MGDLGTFPNRVKETRQNMRMTQKEFSEFVSITQSTLSAYEKGSKNPSLESVKIIAEKCEVSIDWLCGLDTSKFENKKISDWKDLATKIIDILNVNEYMQLVSIPHPCVNELWYDPVAYPDKCYAVAITNSHIKVDSFLYDYQKMKRILDEGTIEREMFEDWLKSALAKLNGIPLDTEV